MAIETNKEINISTGKRIKIETTYEYIPFLGDLLGVWRTVQTRRFGEVIEIHIKTPLSEFDKIVINGDEIIKQKGVIKIIAGRKYQLMEE